MTLIALSGRRFGRLLVVEQAARRNKRTMWRCQCDCGEESTACSQDLLRGHTRSCGCLMRELSRAAARHGQADGRRDGKRTKATGAYLAWQAAKSRCHNYRDIKWPGYGGRGIRMCEEWRKDFVAFFAHVGARPSTKHSLDRINNNGNYEPGNVRWATASEQARNRRPVRAWSW